MQTLFTISIWAIPLLFAITVHETAHGYVAWKLGDPTAKMLGRLTLNPIKHIDPVGTILVPVVLATLGGFIFGWAKPVPIEWRNLKNPRRDIALVGIAGPLSNFIMALLWAMILKISLLTGGKTDSFLGSMAYAGILINLLLMILNSIPIPPLDGSRVLFGLIAPEMVTSFSQLEFLGFLLLALLLATGVLSQIMYPMLMYSYQLIALFFGL